MEDPGLVVDKLREMSTLGLMKAAVRIMRQNFLLFLSFAATFTIPSSIFTVLLLDTFTHEFSHVLDDIIAKGDLIFVMKFKYMISPLALRFGFILVNLALTSWLNTCVCTRGVVSIYRNEELATSIKNSFRRLQWAVLRLIAAQSVLYCVVLIGFVFPFISIGGPYAFFVLVVYHLPIPQVGILERGKYGFSAGRRAGDIACAKGGAACGLGFFSVSYFLLLTVLVDFWLRDSYPLWTKYVAYPVLVLLVTFMSIFWQVLYTLFYLTDKELDLDKLDLDKFDRAPTNVKCSCAAGDVNEPHLGAEVDWTESKSNGKDEAVYSLV